MSQFKDQKRGTWIAKFKYQKKQYLKRGFKTKSAAKAWEEAEKDRLKNPQNTILLTFSQVSTKYIEDCKGRFQKNTWRQKVFVYRNFITFLQEDPPIEFLTKHTIKAYLRNRMMNDGNKCANRDLKELKALFNWGVKEEMLYKNPCINIESYNEEAEPRYVPPVEDVNKVLLVADQDEMDLLMVLYHTAGRIGEVLRLTWNDINFECGWIILKTRKRKNGWLQEDKLKMTDTLCDTLRSRWDRRNKATPHVFPNEKGERFTYDQKRYVMERLCEKAKVKKFGFHAIRHHVASILADSGKASLSQIQKLLRHKRITTTDNYTKTLDPEIAQVTSVLDNQFQLAQEK